MRRPWSVPVALGLLLLASTAAAQTQLPPAPGAPGSIGDWLASDGDPRSVGYLNQLFGPLFAFDGGATETVFSRVIGIFNLVVLGVGGLIFTYNIVVGVLQTAHEGQVLGRRWSSLWAPLRIVFASALLIPLPNGGGYNSLQYVIGYLVKGSTSAANAIWGEVTDSILVQSVPVAGATPPHFAALIQQLWDMEVCRAVVRLQYRDAGLWDGSAPAAPIAGDSREEMRALLDNPLLGDVTLAYFVDETAVIRFGGRPGGGLPEEICGAVALPEVPASILEAERDQPTMGGRNPGPAWDAVISSVEFRKAHLEAVVGAILTLRPAAEAAVATAAARGGSWPSLDLAQVSADMRALLNERVFAVVRASSTREDRARQVLGEYLAENGWTEAGSWYLLLARVSAELNEVLSAQPTTAARPSYVEWLRGMANPGWFDSVTAPASLAQGQAVEQASILKNGADQVFWRAAARAPEAHFRTPSEVVRSATGGDDISDFLADHFGLTAAELFGPALDGLNPFNGGDPLLGIMQLGSTVLAGLAAAIAAVVAAAFLTNVALGFLQATDFFTNLVFAVSASAAIVLPLMPAAVWTFAVLGYILLVAEAVVAAPLWAIAHLRADGEGISGPAADRGYALLLALTLTPLMMVLGLVLGMAAYRVVGGLMNGLLYAVLDGMGGDTIVGIAWLVGFAVVFAVLVLLHLLVIERCFTLVAWLPQAVLRWLSTDMQLDVSPAKQAQLAAAGAAYTAGKAIGPGVQSAVRGAGRFHRLKRQDQNKVAGDPPPG
jgi:conjugal transfer/type IV secretion protein DotA/TraY